MPEETQVAGVIMNEVDGDASASTSTYNADDFAMSDTDLQPCL
jgi:hypothetical protein